MDFNLRRDLIVKPELIEEVKKRYLYDAEFYAKINRLIYLMECELEELFNIYDKNLVILVAGTTLLIEEKQEEFKPIIRGQTEEFNSM